MFKSIVFSLFFFVLGAFIITCTSSQNQAPQSSSSPIPVQTLMPSPVSASIPIKLSWERDPQRAFWTVALLKVIEDNFDVLSKASDINQICQGFTQKPHSVQLNAIAELFAQDSLYESSWNPLNRYTESTMGMDEMTGKQVVSEGLFQLSYQDMYTYPKLKDKGCGIDWQKDKNFDPKSDKKTILDPVVNITCAVLIMTDQIKRKNVYFLTSGNYWSTLRIGGKYSKIPQITKVTQLVCK